MYFLQPRGLLRLPKQPYPKGYDTILTSFVFKTHFNGIVLVNYNFFLLANICQLFYQHQLLQIILASNINSEYRTK
jgi:hypothetical protein